MAKKSKKTKKYDKTFRRTLDAITPSGNVPKKSRPKKQLKGAKLRTYTILSVLAAMLVGPATVFLRAHVDYLGGHRDKSVLEQIECVLTNGIAKDKTLGPWAMGFESACPIRESDYDQSN